MKDKTGAEITRVFTKIFASEEDGNRRPSKLQTDQGKEFDNATFQRFLKQNGVKFFTIKSQFKASLVERFNRTLKEKMWRYFMHKGSHKWLEVLPKLISAYNNAVHRIIRMAAKDVTRENEQRLLDLQNAKGETVSTLRNPDGSHIKVGDHVRLSKTKRLFTKGYMPSWTEEVFTVVQILKNHGKPTQFKVADYHGEVVDGSFYAAEIQKIEKPDTYIIETIIDERGTGKRKQYLVKWLGYEPQFNSWEYLDADIVNNIQQRETA